MNGDNLNMDIYLKQKIDLQGAKISFCSYYLF